MEIEIKQIKGRPGAFSQQQQQQLLLQGGHCTMLIPASSVSFLCPLFLLLPFFYSRLNDGGFVASQRICGYKFSMMMATLT